MSTYVKSVVTAFIIATLVMAVSIGVLAPLPTFPQVVGNPDVSRIESTTHKGVTRLELANTDGNVSISSHDGDEVQITADIRAFVGDSEYRAAAGEYVATAMATTFDNGTLHIVTEPGQRPPETYLYVVYTVLVPRGTDVAVAAENGNVQIGDGCGSVEVKGHNSDIYVAGPLGTVAAESVNGRITLKGAPAGGHLTTVNGNVVADLEGGFLEATTANGIIFVNLLKPVVDGCRLTSQNGGIWLHVKDGSSASINARTARGNVKTDLPLVAASGGISQGHVQGTIGAGSHVPRLEMDALNGNIIIKSTGT